MIRTWFGLARPSAAWTSVTVLEMFCVFENTVTVSLSAPPLSL